MIYDIDAFVDRLLQHMKCRAETGNVEALFADLLDIEDREFVLLTAWVLPLLGHIDCLPGYACQPATRRREWSEYPRNGPV